MKIGQIYVNSNFGRRFQIENIYVNFNGELETLEVHVIVRYIGGFRNGKTANVLMTPEVAKLWLLDVDVA